MSAYFPKNKRLLNPDDFGVVLKNGAGRVTNKKFFVVYRPNELGYPRIGIAISKKLIKKAVGRNRIKRLVRESYRKKKGEFPSVDIVVLGRNGIVDVDNRALHNNLDTLWQKLHEHLGKSQ